jgi:eukaryotic-like serine/threonine-protein kinase
MIGEADYRLLGGYRPTRLLARGGMGAVYEAEHAATGDRVALKVIDRPLAHEPTARERFLREGRILNALRHPNIVRLFEVGLDDDRPFIAMELLSGETLRDRLTREGRLSRAAALELFVPICDAVSAIHRAGVLHRDLKPSNVMLVRRGAATVPVILDFGISKDTAALLEDSTLTRTQGLLGTPLYLSPEQTLNSKAASPRSDQYALGVMLYQCITGLSPFSGASPYELMHAILNAPYRCRPSWPCLAILGSTRSWAQP